MHTYMHKGRNPAYMHTIYRNSTYILSTYIPVSFYMCVPPTRDTHDADDPGAETDLPLFRLQKRSHSFQRHHGGLRIHTHTRAHTYARTHSHTHTHTRARARTHIATHTHTHFAPRHSPFSTHRVSVTQHTAHHVLHKCV